MFQTKKKKIINYLNEKNTANAAVCALWRSQMRFSTAAMRSRTAARI